jgi:hypothetical protein
MSRNFLFRIQGHQIYPSSQDSLVKYMIFQLFRDPFTQEQYVEGYVEFRQTVRPRQATICLNLERAQFTKRDDICKSREAARKYCVCNTWCYGCMEPKCKKGTDAKENPREHQTKNRGIILGETHEYGSFEEGGQGRWPSPAAIYHMKLQEQAVMHSADMASTVSGAVDLSHEVKNNGTEAYFDEATKTFVIPTQMKKSTFNGGERRKHVKNPYDWVVLC